MSEARQQLKSALTFARASAKRSRNCMDDIRWLAEGKTRASIGAFLARSGGDTALARRAFAVRDKIADRFEAAVIRCVTKLPRVVPGKGNW